MALSPGLVLGLIFVAIAAQVTHVFLPSSGSYPLVLALAVAGFLVGEVIALSGRLAGPEVGIIHPLPDIIVVALFQVVAAVLAGRPSVRS